MASSMVLALACVLSTVAPAVADEAAATSPASPAPAPPAPAAPAPAPFAPAAVDLELTPPPPAPPPTASAVTVAKAPASPAKPRRHLYQRWLFWTVAGGLVAGTVAITYAVSRPPPAPYTGNLVPGVFTFP
jgi:hypothetical protein